MVRVAALTPAEYAGSHLGNSSGFSRYGRRIEFALGNKEPGHAQGSRTTARLRSSRRSCPPGLYDEFLRFPRWPARPASALERDVTEPYRENPELIPCPVYNNADKY